MGGGGEGGHGPPERGKYKQLMPSKDGDNMEKEEEEQSHQDRREQSEQPFDQVEFV